MLQPFKAYVDVLIAGRLVPNARWPAGFADQAVLEHSHLPGMILGTHMVASAGDLPSVVGVILCKTQQAMDAATEAAFEAHRLMAQTEQQQGPPNAITAQMQQQSYLAAEAAMESAEQALSVAMKLLQDTQQLVLQHQHRGLPAGLPAAAADRFPPNMRIPMPAQLFAMQQQELDPELQDTCDSLASRSMTHSISR